VSDEKGVENYWPWGISSGYLNADGFEDVFVSSSMSYNFLYGVNLLLLNNRGKGFLDREYILGVEQRMNDQTGIYSFSLDPSVTKDANHRLYRRGQLKESDKINKVNVYGAIGIRSSVIFLTLRMMETKILSQMNSMQDQWF